MKSNYTSRYQGVKRRRRDESDSNHSYNTQENGLCGCRVFVLKEKPQNDDKAKQWDNRYHSEREGARQDLKARRGGSKGDIKTLE